MSMAKKRKSAPPAIPSQRIERRIYVIRNQNVLLDEDLAELYEVPTKALNQAFKRNLERFPDDFAFQLNRDEWTSLRSQTVTSRSWGGRRYPPYAFTEQGVAMLSSVLKSKRAVQVNIEIMRAFVRLRELLAVNKDLAHKIEALERKDAEHDNKFRVVFEAIQELLKETPPTRRRIGFTSDDD